MSVAYLFGGIVLAVFAVAFISSRRFGPLALALAAGSLLASWWSDWAVGVMSSVGLDVAWLPAGVVASLAILLAPLLVLLLGGPRYYNPLSRSVSALMIAVLTAALLVEPLGRYLALDTEALKVYKWFSDIWLYVATVGLILGIVDLFMLHTKSSGHSRSKKH